jgi:hypothetical protein
MKYKEVFYKDVNINGINIKSEVTVKVVDDCNFDLSDWDLFEDRKRIQSGEITVVEVIVSAIAYGIEGIECLGQCTVGVKSFEADLKSILDDYKLIENALGDLKTKIINQVEQLKQFI